MASPVVETLKLYRGKADVLNGVATADDGTPLDVRGILRFQARRAFGDADTVIDKTADDFVITGAGNNIYAVAISPEDTEALPADRFTHLYFELQAASSAEDPVALAVGEIMVFPSVITTAP